jgi:two-component system, cell cycle sensor histidine kinase and response regulator CckA
MCPWLPTVSGVLQPPSSGTVQDPLLTRLHQVSDAIVIGALGFIAFVLLFLVFKRREEPFAGAVAAFAVFLLVLSAVHLLTGASWIDLDPVMSGVAKCAGALAAVVSTVALIRILPTALRLPTPEDARRLQAAADDRVRERTAELTAANERLAAEIRQREAAEAEVRHLNLSLENRVSDLQTLFEFIPIGVGIAKDLDCSVIQMNPALAIILNLPPTANASLYGTPGEKQTFKVFRRGVQLESHQLPMQIAARENQPVLDFEMSIVRNDGITLDVLVSAVPLRDRTGHARGCVATFQDITQRKRSEQERLEFERRIQETQKLESLGVLSGGIAHDFNNLLTGVLGHANLARFSLVEGQTTVAQALDHIERSAQRAADLCKQLLAYAGKGRFHVQPLNLSRLVEDMSHLLTLSITQKASLELQLANDLPPVMGDATQLRQVVMNLVINAAEAMPPGRGTGSITVRTNHVHATIDYLRRAGFQDTVAEGSYLELEVSDNGVGMTPETQAKIFDPFFTTKFTGRGLGLAAVLGIVRSHKGTIRVYSEVGRGTTFKLLFPTAPGTPSAPPMPIPTAENWRGSGTALVIDDEETVRSVARRALERLGFSVILATDGVEGLEKFRTSGPYAIVLLDLTMPRLDGEQTFRALHAADPRLPILLMSGFNEQSAVERFVGQGLAGFLPKPFTVDLLARRVREALATRPTE